MRELRRISQEENRRIVGHEIPITLVGLELHAEASGIASAVVRAGFATNGGKADCDGTFCALLEHVCEAEVVECLCSLVDSMSATSLCMHDSLGNTLAVEVGEEID